MSNAEVVAVCRDDEHRFSKDVVREIVLLTGLGVQGDAHQGVAVQHRSRVAADPTQPNLRQVHLIAHELLDELRAEGYDVNPGQLGENITTRGLDLLALSSSRSRVCATPASRSMPSAPGCCAGS
jgi:MOSC domain-containing protein YiiM